MDYIEKLEKYFVDKHECGSVKIGDNIGWNADLELSEWYTADDYTLYVMTNDARNIDWENDVYYYEPQFDTIMDRIEETCHDLGYGEEVKIYIDTEAFLPEEEVLNWLNVREDEPIY